MKTGDTVILHCNDDRDGTKFIVMNPESNFAAGMMDAVAVMDIIELPIGMVELSHKGPFSELEQQLAAANAEIARLQLALTQIVTIANSSKEVTSYIKHMVDMFTIAEAALKSPTEP